MIHRPCIGRATYSLLSNALTWFDQKKKCDYIFQLHYFSRVRVHVHWCKDTCTYVCVHVEVRSQAQVSFLTGHPPCF